MKKLQEQQKRLQASSVRIEGMLKQMSSACHDKDTAAAKSKLPKEMSVSLKTTLLSCVATDNFRQRCTKNIHA